MVVASTASTVHARKTATNRAHCVPLIDRLPLLHRSPVALLAAPAQCNRC
jgi:hypothetical protein